ncbi:MAG: [Kiritimatiellae bacterium]|nr:[FeFe] hydrogenase H-cluster radical SAM maturase HydE [Kiritimatiellia bacterium]MBR3777238.1 [FeFe] hydrogenase H-cluster radical SAM maturase HydE [Kiritimatiellia bacterium]
MKTLIDKAMEKPCNLSLDEIERLLSLSSSDDRTSLRKAARALKHRYFGNKVSIRGIIELGNICAKDCYYCGIRKSNRNVERYRLSIAEIERMAETNAALGYKSLVLQGGEIESEENTRFIEETLKALAKFDFGITLSLGEQTKDVYRRWKDAGASRYLLRIETSNRELYSTLHPPSCDWRRRAECLKYLNECGYQTGTGTMSSLPGQTINDLAHDIVFFNESKAVMIGMGPYLSHPDTPLAKCDLISNQDKLERALDMIAVTRLYLHDVNIASTTALEALAADGREQGILAGANVVMPNVTDVTRRKAYQLYSGKPGLDETSLAAKERLDAALAAIGEEIDYATRGDSPRAQGE